MDDPASPVFFACPGGTDDPASPVFFACPGGMDDPASTRLLRLPRRHGRPRVPRLLRLARAAWTTPRPPSSSPAPAARTSLRPARSAPRPGAVVGAVVVGADDAGSSSPPWDLEGGRAGSAVAAPGASRLASRRTTVNASRFDATRRATAGHSGAPRRAAGLGVRHAHADPAQDPRHLVLHHVGQRSGRGGGAGRHHHDRGRDHTHARCARHPRERRGRRGEPTVEHGEQRPPRAPLQPLDRLRGDLEHLGDLRRVEPTEGPEQVGVDLRRCRGRSAGRRVGHAVVRHGEDVGARSRGSRRIGAVARAREPDLGLHRLGPFGIARPQVPVQADRNRAVIAATLVPVATSTGSTRPGRASSVSTAQVPPPSAASSSIAPPHASVRSRTIVRPMPIPAPPSASARQKRSNARARSASDIPGP